MARKYSESKAPDHGADVPHESGSQYTRPQQGVGVDNTVRNKFGAELLQPGEAKHIIKAPDHMPQNPTGIRALRASRLIRVVEWDDSAGDELESLLLEGGHRGHDIQLMASAQGIRPADKVLKILPALADLRADEKTLDAIGPFNDKIAALFCAFQRSRAQK